MRDTFDNVGQKPSPASSAADIAPLFEDEDEDEDNGDEEDEDEDNNIDDNL